MSDFGTNKKIVKKEVNYLGRDFTDIRENLIEFAKNYFPNQYNVCWDGILCRWCTELLCW